VIAGDGVNRSDLAELADKILQAREGGHGVGEIAPEQNQVR
jgi:hypothetical protein